MEQANSGNNSKDALQRKEDQHLTHNRAALRWLTRNWQALVFIGSVSVAGVGGAAFFLWLAGVIDDLGLALNFAVQSTLSWLIFLALIVQLIINHRQWRSMRDGLEIERAKTDPRLRIAEVTAESFEVGKRPFYVVTIANDGLFAATNVRIHMSVKINERTPMDWINDVVVTIPASGEGHHFIHSSFWLSQEQLESFEMSRDSLRVVGFFEHAPVGRVPFCYKYLPLQGEYRPPKIPQFVTCDYTPQLNTTVQLTGVEVKTFVGTRHITHKRSPEKAAPTEKGDNAKSENDDEEKPS